MSAKEELELVQQQNTLTPLLIPGETLLCTTKGKIRAVGGFSSKEVFVGLTTGRLLIYGTRWEKNSPRLFAFSLAQIKSLYFKTSGWSSSMNGLRVKFSGEELTIQCKGFWKTKAEEMASRLTVSQPADSSSASTASSETFIQFVHDLNDLGLNVAAQTELENRMSKDPVLKTDPRAIEIKEDLHAIRLAMQIGAGFFAGWMLLMLFLAVIGMATINFIGLIVDCLIIYNLWQGKKTWRSTGVFLAGLITVLELFINLSLGKMPYVLFDVAMWISFGLSTIIILTGKSSRTRIWICTAIYLLGFVGVFIAVLMLGSANML